MIFQFFRGNEKYRGENVKALNLFWKRGKGKEEMQENISNAVQGTKTLGKNQVLKKCRQIDIGNNRSILRKCERQQCA